jgi:DNA-directed RNA polymerase specialized sigma24 family protein
MTAVSKHAAVETADDLRVVLRDLSAQIAQVRSALQELLDRQTQVFAELRRRGLVYREIGDDAGITAEGVMRRIRLSDDPSARLDGLGQDAGPHDLAL